MASQKTTHAKRKACTKKAMSVQSTTPSDITSTPEGSPSSAPNDSADLALSGTASTSTLDDDGLENPLSDDDDTLPAPKKKKTTQQRVKKVLVDSEDEVEATEAKPKSVYTAIFSPLCSAKLFH
jgi:hypothetical protein